MTNRLRASFLGLVFAVCAPLAAASFCSAGDVELQVFAAASLTDAFNEIGRLFTAQHPGVDVVVNFAGSQQLAAQIVEAAPADVFASASNEQMKKVADAGLVSGTAKPFRERLAFYRTRQEAVAEVAALKARGIIGFVAEAVPPPAPAPGARSP